MSEQIKVGIFPGFREKLDGTVKLMWAIKVKDDGDLIAVRGHRGRLQDLFDDMNKNDPEHPIDGEIVRVAVTEVEAHGQPEAKGEEDSETKGS